jgi:hypothetical protein
MKSTIEYFKVDSKFFFEVEKIEFDVLTEDSYERDVKSNFGNERTFAEFSKSEETEVKEFESRALTI